MKKIMVVFSTACALSTSVYTQAHEDVTSDTAEESSAAQVGLASQKVFIDPKTGALIQQPADVDINTSGNSTTNSQVSEDLGQSQSSAITLSGVASEPKLMPDGSRKIDFNGQFMTPIKAAIDANGDLITGHHVEEHQEHKGK